MRRHQFPYKTQPCQHCRPEDLTCEFCDGTHREIKLMDEERQSVREAISGYLGALHRVAEALGKVGRRDA